MGNDMTRYQDLRALLHRTWERTVADIESQVGRRLVRAHDTRPDPADLEDLAAGDLAEGVDTTLLQMRFQRYKDIAEAFRRFEAGTYGVCEQCGAEIPIARLQAEPFTRLCIRDAEQREAVERVEREEARFQSSHTPPRRP